MAQPFTDSDAERLSTLWQEHTAREQQCICYQIWNNLVVDKCPRHNTKEMIRAKQQNNLGDEWLVKETKIQALEEALSVIKMYDSQDNIAKEYVIEAIQKLIVEAEND